MGGRAGRFSNRFAAPWHDGYAHALGMRLAAILFPSSRIVALPGPTNAMPAFSQRCANEARSARNPQPTQTASTRARRSASITAGSSR